MRVNIYAEEMTNRVEIVEKVINGQTFTGLRIYLELPVTKVEKVKDGWNRECTTYKQLQGPFIHGEGDDDSSAVTFWGKKDLRGLLLKAMDVLDHHYGERFSGNIKD